MMKVACNPAYLFAHFAEDLTYDQLIQGIKGAHKLGFAGLALEVYGEKQYKIFSDKNIEEIKKLYKSLGLGCSCFVTQAVKENLASLDKGKRKEALDGFKLMVDMVRKLEIIPLVSLPSAAPPELVSEYMATYPGGPPAKISLPDDVKWADIYSMYLETVKKALDIVTKYGLKLAVEPLPYTIISNTDSFLKLAEDIDSDSFGIYLDTSHVFYQREYLPISVEKIGDKMFGVGVCDNDGIVDAHWPPGEGNIEWPEFLKALKKIGYDGYVDIEINEAEDPDKTYLETKKYLETVISKQ